MSDQKSFERWLDKHCLDDTDFNDPPTAGDAMQKSSHNNLYVLTVHSESGDHYGPYLFDSKPSEDQLETFLRERMPDEFPTEKGPGWRDSYVHLDLTLESVYEVP